MTWTGDHQDFMKQLDAVMIRLAGEGDFAAWE